MRGGIADSRVVLPHVFKINRCLDINSVLSLREMRGERGGEGRGGEGGEVRGERGGEGRGEGGEGREGR